MKKKIFAFCIALLAFLSVEAQTLKAYERAGMEALQDKNYFGAVKYFKIVLDVSANRTDVWYNYAEAARLFNSFSLAEKAYERVIELDEKGEYPLTLYWLGLVKKQLGKYDEALMAFQEFMGSAPLEDQYFNKTQREINACKLAQEIVNDSIIGLKVNRLDEKVNSNYTEFGPFIKNDTLYYSSLQFQNPKVDEREQHPMVSRVLMAPMDFWGEVWSEPFWGDSMNIAHAVFNTTGNKLYFNKCYFVNTNDLICDLYETQKLPGGMWDRPEKVSRPINLGGYTTTQPSIAFDEHAGKEVLFFASDRPGGIGKLDIWQAYINADGSFDAPQLVKGINTTENEATPFYFADDKTLYFSSDGLPGLGGYDVFKSSKQDGKWSEPEHMGYPLNSSYNDVYYFIDNQTLNAYLSSNRLGSLFVDEAMESCCNDIYEVSYGEVVSELVIATFDRKSNIALKGVTTEMLELPNETEQTFRHPDKNIFSVDLKNNKKYQFVHRKQGYTSDTFTLSTLGLLEPKTFHREVYLELLDLDLEVQMYDRLTKKPLNGAKVEVLTPLKTESLWERKFDDNVFSFDLGQVESFSIIGEKEGYVTDTVRLHLDKLDVNGNRIIHKFYLEPKPSDILTLSDFLPLPLYFDNNQPSRQEMEANTLITYAKMFDNYYKRKPVFKQRYSEGLTGEAKILAEAKIENFFEHNVRLEYENFKGFLDHLINYLEQGNRAELLIKGYASPLADAKYNEILTKKRTTSLQNEILQYKDGVLLPYYKEGKLLITEKPFGETKAPPYVSDNATDRRNSVYSVEACKERRIEILEIKDNKDFD